MTLTRRAGRPVAILAGAMALGLAGWALMLSLASTTQATDPGVRYIAPVASGLADGSSWENATDLLHLPSMVVAAGAGGQVLLRADVGPYTPAPISLRHGGLHGATVTIRGVAADGTEMPAIIAGSRTSPYSVTGLPGGEVFRLLAGASHLRFTDIGFENIGTAFRVAGDVSDLTIQSVTASNVRRFFEDLVSGLVGTATVDHMTIRRVTVNGFSQGVIRLQYDSHDILLQDIVGDSQQQDGDNFAMGVHLDGTAHYLTLRRVSMSNALDTLGSYWNGDGFTVEHDVHDVTFDHTTSSGNSDAGYDIKASHVALNAITATDNKKNVRLWGEEVTLTDCTLTDPYLRGGVGDQTQLWLSDDAQVVATSCVISDSSPATVVFGVGTASSLTTIGGSVTYLASASFRRGPSTATIMMYGTQVILSPVPTPASQPH